EPAHGGDDVVVLRFGIGHAGRQPDVGGHHGGAGGGADGEVLGVGEAADVVAHYRAGLVGGGRHPRPPRVDGDGHVETGAQRLEGGHDTVELLLERHLGPGAGLDAAHVD